MTIYLEYIFLENLIMDFIILKETLELAKIKINNKRIILASLISSLYVVVMLAMNIKELNYILSKIFLALCMIYIAAKPETVIIYAKCVLFLFLVSAVNIGTYTVFSNIFNIRNETGLEKALIYIFTYYIAKMFLTKIWRIYITELNKKELNYTVEIQILDKKYNYIGFLDTGNTVYSHGVPVIFAELINEKMLEQLKHFKCFEVKTVTLGNVCTKKAYILERVKIKKGNKTWIVKAGVVFENRKISRLNNYNMVLNYILYTESMGGVRI